MGMKIKVVFFLALVAVSFAETVQDYEQGLTRQMDEINEKERIPIYGDMVSLEKMMDDTTLVGRGSPDPLVNRIEKFFRTHKLQIQLPSDGSPADLLGRALGWKRKDVELKGLVQGASEARTKLKKLMMPLMIALQVKNLIVVPAVATMIGIIGLTSIGSSILAMIISGGVALSSIHHPHPVHTARVTYAGRPHEIHHDHWHRSQEEVQEPFRGWLPEYGLGEQYPYQEVA